MGSTAWTENSPVDDPADSDPPSGYLAGINPSCVPSVVPRFPGIGGSTLLSAATSLADGSR